MKNIWDFIGYLSLGACLLGQIVVGWGYLLAQFVFLSSNILATVRAFKIDQPAPDKVKNVCFTSVTIALILLYFIR